MKKNNNWNIRHLNDEMIVPSTQQLSVLYSRLSDFSTCSWNIFIKKVSILVRISLLKLCIKIDSSSEIVSTQCGGPAAFSSPAQQHKSYQLLIRLNLLEINAVLLSHCRFLMPGNTQKILTEIWHQFWDKNDGENICHWNYFQIPWALLELPANWPCQFSQKGWLGRTS